MQPYNPAIPGYTFSRLLNGRQVRKQENAGKPRFLVINALLHSLLLLQPSALWLSIVTFNNDAKPPPKWILSEFSIANPTPARRVTPPWNVYMEKSDPGWEG